MESLSEALKRPAHLPQHLKAQYGFGGFGGPLWCVIAPGAEPMANGQSPGCAAEVASTLNLVFSGFDPAQEIAVQVTPPHGASYVHIIEPIAGRQPEWEWTPVPGDPLGPYEFTAIQGELKAHGTISAGRASERLAAIIPREGEPGTVFTVALAGFRPHELVQLWLYRYVGMRDRTTYEFTASLTPVRTDKYGETIYYLHTSQDDTISEYLIVTDPPSQFGPAVAHRTFRLTSSLKLLVEFFAISRDVGISAANELGQFFKHISFAQVLSPLAASPVFSEFSPLLLTVYDSDDAGPLKGTFEGLGTLAEQGALSALQQALEAGTKLRANRGWYTFGVRIERPDSVILFQYNELPGAATLGKSLKNIPKLVGSLRDHPIAEFVFIPQLGEWSKPNIPSAPIQEVLRRSIHSRHLRLTDKSSQGVV